MNELEAMKANYKKLLKGQRATRTSLSQLGSTSTINKESERSTGHLEKTLSGYSNFSVTKKKEKNEKLIFIENDYTRNDSDGTRMNRLNKLQNLQIEPPSDYKHRFTSYTKFPLASESSRNKPSQQLEQIREGFVETARRELKNDWQMAVLSPNNPYLQGPTATNSSTNKRRNATSMTNFDRFKSERGHRRNFTKSEAFLPVLLSK